MSNFLNYAEPHFILWVDACEEHMPTISMRADSAIFYQEVPLVIHEAVTYPFIIYAKELGYTGEARIEILCLCFIPGQKMKKGPKDF